MRTPRLTATASYLPERWVTASEIADHSGIPEDVIVERFGITGKHVAAPDEHVSDMSLAVANRLLEEQDIDPSTIDAVVYFGSTHKDYQVWQAAPYIADRLGATNAFALELDYMSCGSPVMLRVVGDMIRAETEVNRVLAVAACRESYLLDYENERSRFMFSFGDGAVAALLESGDSGHELLGSHMLTDGSFSLDVKVPAGGSVEPTSDQTLAGRRHFLDVPDPQSMKERLDPISVPNFIGTAKEACARSGVSTAEISLLCGIHMKRSLHLSICESLGLTPEQAVYLDDTGHMSGVDPLLALDRASRQGRLSPGDIVLVLAAGTGYTWAASCIRW